MAKEAEERRGRYEGEEGAYIDLGKRVVTQIVGAVCTVCLV